MSLSGEPVSYIMIVHNILCIKKKNNNLILNQYEPLKNVRVSSISEQSFMQNVFIRKYFTTPFKFLVLYAYFILLSTTYIGMILCATRHFLVICIFWY